MAELLSERELQREQMLMLACSTCRKLQAAEEALAALHEPFIGTQLPTLSLQLMGYQSQHREAQHPKFHAHVTAMLEQRLDALQPPKRRKAS